MFEVENKIVDSLETIDILMPDAGGVMKDDVDDFVVRGGMQFPIVQVSKTILRPADIQNFRLSMGWNWPVPQANVVIRDEQGMFRDTDFINGKTKLRLWLGNSRSDEKPINFQMRVYDAQVHANSISVYTTLDIPNEPITIKYGTLQDILQAFADKTGLGIRCNRDDMLSLQVTQNFVMQRPAMLLSKLFKAIGVKWFIDRQYNVCIYDLEKAIAEHQDKECPILLMTNEELETPQKVVYDNNMQEPSQFKFAKFGYDKIVAKKPQNDIVNVDFDKSAELDLSMEQATEDEFIDIPDEPDTDDLYIEDDFDPYKIVGETMQLNCWTTMNRPKRATTEEYESGDKKTLDQELIEDISGIYMLCDCKYMYNAGQNLEAWAAFRRPLTEEEETDNSDAPVEYNNQANPAAADYASTLPESEPDEEVVSNARPMSSDEKIVTVMNYLMSHGLTKIAAAAFCGNFLKESGLDVNVDVMDSNNLMSAGIACWNGPRRTSLMSQPNWKTLEGQCAFVIKELSSAAFTTVKSKANSTSDISEATFIVMYYYEAPKERARGGANHLARTAQARIAYNKV